MSEFAAFFLGMVVGGVIAHVGFWAGYVAGRRTTR